MTKRSFPTSTTIRRRLAPSAYGRLGVVRPGAGIFGDARVADRGERAP
jgi:hypothetical protein